MDHERIQIRTSIPSLQNKVQVRISGPADAIHWYIRFNIELDPESVSGKTMNVTDTDGYIMRTVISYRSKHNLISVSPLDTYEEDRFYLLNISKSVRSIRGRHLRSTIHILFKLKEDKVSEFKVLDKDAEVPTPRPRPKDYDTMPRSKTPNHFERQYIDSSPPGKMAAVGFFINPALGILGLIIAAAGVFWPDIPDTGIMAIGMGVCLAGIIHVVMQLRNAKIRSKMQFNKGVRLFNHERYFAAEDAFRAALATDPNNELANHGIRKAKIYQSTPEV